MSTPLKLTEAFAIVKPAGFESQIRISKFETMLSEGRCASADRTLSLSEEVLKRGSNSRCLLGLYDLNRC